MDPRSPDCVSAIVCCHNSEGIIAPTLAALAGQTLAAGQEFEIIVVDNCCTDGTMRIAREILERSGREFRILREDRIGLINARATGVRAARHPVVLFVDDDNILGMGYVERLSSIFAAHPDVGVVGGYAEPYLRDLRLPDWFFHVQGIFACGPQQAYSGTLAGRKQHLYGAGLAFRAALLREALHGPVPPVLTGRTGNRMLRGDDTELCYRIRIAGARLYYDERLRLRHNIDGRRVSWKNVCTMRRETGVTWILLNIYDRIILGMTPPSIAYMRGLLVFRWLRFLSKPRNLVCMWLPGKTAALSFQFLLGMSYSVLYMGRRYTESRRAIMQHCRPGAA
jgi:glycosyltransferase involved in cell wall biosynthesis